MLRRGQKGCGDISVFIRETREGVGESGAHIQHVRTSDARVGRTRRVQLYHASAAEFNYNCKDF